MTEPLNTRYEPGAVEARWYEKWLAAKTFKPESVRPGGRPYVIVIPPPNVTGVLHMGHALNNTLQDVLVRWKRLQGFRALWVPGTDHAGIATQNVVEKALAKEGRTRHDLGREGFLARTWEWKEKYGGTIIRQLQRLGCSCDWDRCRFTMDEGLSRAVLTAFVELFDKGLIYRGERLVNWCPRCRTALSDEEAEASEEGGKFWHLRYPVKGEPGRFVVVATTRPETMLGDVAVAVHPDDERYRGLVGRKLILPLLKREIPVVADAYADPTKGSGAVKITPAHDFNDFAVGERQGLPRIRIFDDGATMNENAGPYRGLERFEARAKILADLEEQGLVERVEEKEVPLPRCYRCNTVVEPHLSMQWFVKMRPLLEPASAAVREGRVRILPERYVQTYLAWVEQYRDWCISRQIWWGHRIPVWYDADDVPCASLEPLAVGAPHPKTGKPIVRQDPDVLDTWFSSQLWPFSVFGWPDKTADLATYYPTDALLTAREIIYFWVARMVMCGLEFMGREPFHTVYINGTVLDSIGRRMSKSLGNGIDPLEMGEKFGTDAVRWTLVSLSTEGQDIKLAESRFEGGRNFVNKLWNASRFALMNLEGYEPAGLTGAKPTAPEDRWILSRLEVVVRDVTASLETMRFHEATQRLYEFTWNSFCDWYIELSKGRLADASPDGAKSRRDAQGVLVRVLDTLLRLLSPIIPFVTEEIRAQLRPHLRDASEFLMLDRWPAFEAQLVDEAAETEVERLIALVRSARGVRDRLGLPRGAPLSLVVRARDEATVKIVNSVKARAIALGRFASIEAGTAIAKPPQSVAVVEEAMEIFVPLAGLIDLDAERTRLAKEIGQCDGWIAAARKKLENQGFLAKAKPEVVDAERAKLAELEDRVAKLRANLADLG